MSNQQGVFCPLCFVKWPKRGFTLVELLVVIAIIAFLATLAAATLTSARAKSRDAKRVQDISTIVKALALYVNAAGKGYPLSAGECINNNSKAGQMLVTSEAIYDIPADPLWGTESPNPNSSLDIDGYCFYYASSAPDTFTIDYFLEGESVTGMSGQHQADPTKMY